MRVGFAGTPPFAAAVLSALLDAGHPVPLVLTRPDRPRGRGLKLEPSAIGALAASRGLVVAQPATLKTDDARAPIVAVALDVLVVAAYGLILPQPILDWPTHGCINVHASLLPRWRGAAPIERAILAGDQESGVTLMQMDAGLDTGPTLAHVPVAIGSRETAGTLHDRLAAAGGEAIVAALERLARLGSLGTTPQPAAGVTYAAKIARADALIRWSDDAFAIDRRVRAMNPNPGAVTMLDLQPYKIWQAEPSADDVAAAPGTIVAATAQGVVVACGAGQLRVVELQPAGGRRMRAADCVAGRRIAAGRCFTTPAEPVSTA
jgi:methionyl-tRNA formyltransferase